MWSEKWLPKPGSAKIAARSWALLAFSLRMVCQMKFPPAMGSCVVIVGFLRG